jgi:hypothetical protein
MNLKRFAGLRDSLGIAAAHSVKREPTKNNGVVVVSSILPSGSMLITAVNFSDANLKETINLPKGSPKKLKDLWTDKPVDTDGKRMSLTLKPLSFRLILVPQTTNVRR